MTTAYTSLLGLALPVSGELAGVWGDTVNNYITSYLDAAVAGAQTISGTQTAVTLSVTNGSSLTQVGGSGSTGSSQYQIINCTGNPAGLLTITAPAASKVYLILNSTSTSQSVKLVGAGPTTGVTVISGEKALVAWNGSDFVKVASTAAAGGSNTQVQYNNNGVLAGSSNLTFDGTSLTLGGNPTLSAGTANGVLYLNGSKVATSGSALTFASSTLTVNNTVSATNGTNIINVDSVNQQIASFVSGVGYGTLNLNGSPLVFQITGSEQMRLTSTGLGIGTSSPGAKQHIYLNAANNTLQIIEQAYSSRGANTQYKNLYNSALYVGIAGDTTGDAIYYNSANSRSLFYNNSTLQMTLDASGNLGIGTSSPSGRLNVAATAATNTTGLNLTGSTTGYHRVLFSNTSGGGQLGVEGSAGGSIAVGTTAYATVVGDYANNPLQFVTNNNVRATIDSAGNLGLGVTPSAWATLTAAQVTSSAFVAGDTAALYIGNRAYYNGGWKYGVTGAGVSYYQQYLGAHTWFTAPSGTAGNAISFTQAMTLFASGGLSLGNTSDPGAGNVNISGNVSLVTNGTSFQWTNSGNNVAINGASGVLAFYTGTSAYNERARIDSSGNLLVGTTSAYASSRFRVKSSGTGNSTYNIEAENSAGTILFTVRDDGYFCTGVAAVSPYNATTANAANLYVNASDGGLYRSTSSIKYKIDVQDATHGLAEVMQLRPVTYKGKNDGDTVFGGLIAEEVHTAGLTEFVHYAQDGSPDALAYGNMVSLCIKAIQELKAEVDSLKSQLKGA